MRDTDERSSVTIDPEVILAARADRVASGAGSDAGRRANERPAYHVAEVPPPTVDTTFRPADADAPHAAGGRSAVATWALRTG
ncbi:MAG: hypothetical protein WA702_29885, partial [Bradyrhizobium sp.]